MNDLKIFIHYCFSFIFTNFYLVPRTKFKLHLRFAFIKCSTQQKGHCFRNAPKVSGFI